MADWVTISSLATAGGTLVPAAFHDARRRIEARETLGVSVMYGDLEGGQRTITRFAMVPRPDGGWLISAGRVGNVDRPAPR